MRRLSLSPSRTVATSCNLAEPQNKDQVCSILEDKSLLRNSDNYFRNSNDFRQYIFKVAHKFFTAKKTLKFQPKRREMFGFKIPFRKKNKTKCKFLQVRIKTIKQSSSVMTQIDSNSKTNDLTYLNRQHYYNFRHKFLQVFWRNTE